MNLFSKISSLSFWDVGTAMGRLYTPDQGIVLSEPSCVTQTGMSREILMAGVEALSLKDKVPLVFKTVPAMARGQVCSTQALTTLLLQWQEALQKKERRFTVLRSAVVGMSAFCDLTHQRALTRSFRAAGFNSVKLLPTALGIALSHSAASARRGVVVVDMGAGKIEVAYVKDNGIVGGKKIEIGGDVLDAQICQYIMQKYALVISIMDARLLRQQSVFSKNSKKVKIAVRGVNTLTNQLTTIQVTSEELIDILHAFLMPVLEMLKESVEFKTQEILLAGGMSQSLGLAQWFGEELRMPIACIARPIVADVLGLSHLYSYIHGNA